jgi:hypothetical protein
MENMFLQILFIIGIISFIIVIIILIRKKSLMLKYSLLWLFSSILMLIVSIFPNILTFISTILGFQIVSNAIFALLLGFILMILLSLTSIVSKQTQRIKTLIQANALLEKRVRKLENINND